jgi:hypothetical protein
MQSWQVCCARGRDLGCRCVACKRRRSSRRQVSRLRWQTTRFNTMSGLAYRLAYKLGLFGTAYWVAYWMGLQTAYTAAADGVSTADDDLL